MGSKRLSTWRPSPLADISVFVSDDEQALCHRGSCDSQWVLRFVACWTTASGNSGICEVSRERAIAEAKGILPRETQNKERESFCCRHHDDQHRLTCLFWSRG